VLTPADATDDASLRDLVTRRLAETTGVSASVVTGYEWTSSFRIHRRLADTYRAGNVLLAGDAAHIHSPMGGQGMNTGLGDAENLGWKLALVEQGRAGEALLDTYEAERRPIATDVLGSTSAMTRMMLGGSTATRLVRDHVLVPLMNRPAVQRLIWEASSQLKITYRRGPLGGGRFGSAPQPGDRMPDLRCARADGTPTRLHAELGGRWALLTTDDDAVRVAETRLGPGAVAVLRPRDHDRTLLVRPDGHLAARGEAGNLSRWLDQALGTSVPVAIPA
jgi:4,5-epoxidase